MLSSLVLVSMMCLARTQFPYQTEEVQPMCPAPHFFDRKLTRGILLLQKRLLGRVGGSKLRVQDDVVPNYRDETEQEYNEDFVHDGPFNFSTQAPTGNASSAMGRNSATESTSPTTTTTAAATTRATTTSKASTASQALPALNASNASNASRAFNASSASNASQTLPASNASNASNASRAFNASRASNGSQALPASNASNASNASKATNASEPSNKTTTSTATTTTTTTTAATTTATTTANITNATNVTNITNTSGQTCVTKYDPRVSMMGYTTAEPGTPCLFGLDDRDEGHHCILDDGKYGSLGWCFTSKDKYSWGGCSEACPLFGQAKILGNRLDNISKVFEAALKKANLSGLLAAARDASSNTDNTTTVTSTTATPPTTTTITTVTAINVSNSTNTTNTFKKKCVTKFDPRATMFGYTTADPGTPCIFGLDDRDEGEHCILDGGKYGSLGWCFTSEDKYSWGSCDEGCPLFGQAKILGKKLDNVSSELKSIKEAHRNFTLPTADQSSNGTVPSHSNSSEGNATTVSNTTNVPNATKALNTTSNASNLSNASNASNTTRARNASRASHETASGNGTSADSARNVSNPSREANHSNSSRANNTSNSSRAGNSSLRTTLAQVFEGLRGK